MIDRKALTGQAARPTSPSTAYDPSASPSTSSGCNSGYEFVTVMVGLSQDEADLVRWLRQAQGFGIIKRLREMKAQRHQLAIVQFTDKGLQCREVGKLEG